MLLNSSTSHLKKKRLPFTPFTAVQVGDLLLVLGHLQFALLLEYLGLGVPAKGGVCETVCDVVQYVFRCIDIQAFRSHNENIPTKCAIWITFRVELMKKN